MTRELAAYRELAAIVDTIPVLMRGARRARGLSLRAAAKELGMANSTLYRIEQGEDYSSRSLPSMLRWLGST
jgi:transcriptional regulator with XRE-family HTH domain